MRTNDTVQLECWNQSSASDCVYRNLCQLASCGFMNVGMRLKGGSADGTLVAAASMPPSNISAQWADKYLDKAEDVSNCNLSATAQRTAAPDASTSASLTTCSFCTADDLNLNKKYLGFDQTCTSSESSPGEELSLSITSESSDSEEVTAPPILKRGIINPNYPGFQHLADQLLNSCDDEIACVVNNKNKLKNINYNIINNNNNNVNDNNNNSNSSDPIRNTTSENRICGVDSVNQLSSDSYKKFYDTPKFNIPIEDITSDVSNISLKLENSSETCKSLDKNLDDSKSGSESFLEVYVGRNLTNMATNIVAIDLLKDTNKMADAFLSGVKDEIKPTVLCKDANKAAEDILDKLNKDEKGEKGKSPGEKNEKEDDPVVPRKKEKMEINYSVKKNWSHTAQTATAAPPPPPSSASHGQGLLTCRARTESTRSASSIANRRSLPMMREKKKVSPESLGSFDVYNIETAMPYIDLDAIESHLKAAREEDLRRRNDREEIRRRLATGCDTDEYYGGDRPGKKPSLQARLQSGMNLQICFMNDTMSDTESPGTETPETASVTPSPIKAKTNPEPPRAANLPSKCVKSGLSLPLNNCTMTEADFFARQARLQSEARVALAQAKDMARMQMEVERQQRQASPITEMLRTSLRKVGVHFPEERRRLSRQMLTDMNLAQLQVIVNDLHTQIEYLNEGLVKFLMERDDLHMSQDSMLVDIEDLTRYLGAKENTLKEDISQNNNVITTKPKINRILNGVKK